MNPLDNIDQQIQRILHPDFTANLGLKKAYVFSSKTVQCIITKNNVIAILMEIWQCSRLPKISPVSLLIKDSHENIVLNTTIKIHEDRTEGVNEEVIAYETVFKIHFIIDSRRLDVIQYYFTCSKTYYDGEIEWNHNGNVSSVDFYQLIVGMKTEKLKNIVRVLFNINHDLPFTVLEKYFVIVFHDINLSKNRWHYSVRGIE